MEKARVLVVDDEVANLKLVKEILKFDYTIVLAKTGEEALRRAEDLPDLILLDVMMPGIDGYEVCRQLHAKQQTQDIPVIFVTAMGEQQDETKGFTFGAVDYITKPVKPPVLRARVKTHLELRWARKQLENHNTILEERVQERTKELRESRLEIVHRLVSAAEYKDPETGSHIQRMSLYSRVLAREYGLSQSQCETIHLASPMHDIGKIGIPDSILLKPGRLDPEEWSTMRTHTTIGARILAHSTSPLLQAGQEIAISHHEKWDGSGYPQGLQGGAIPLFGRITAISDVFDALTTKRPYKEAWPVEKAIEEIREGKGQHFDPALIDLFFAVLPELLDIRERFRDEV